ncbi:YcxB family protein [Metabacillus litoralis]|uniref:YcxB family protein n=1 Tax=Metabacillus litoralis TaxID=152268 RepID=UPI001CFD8836|nr:YcxB family protein [Metabacillus litoralis]
MKEGKNEGLLGDHVMLLSDEEIVDITSTGETKVKWVGIKSFKEDSSYFYLYNSSVSSYIIPKRNLPNEKAFRTLVDSRTSF